MTPEYHISLGSKISSSEDTEVRRLINMSSLLEFLVSITPLVLIKASFCLKSGIEVSYVS
jgi:hypothetical protein